MDWPRSKKITTKKNQHNTNDVIDIDMLPPTQPLPTAVESSSIHQRASSSITPEPTITNSNTSSGHGSDDDEEEINLVFDYRFKPNGSPRYPMSTKYPQGIPASSLDAPKPGFVVPRSSSHYGPLTKREEEFIDQLYALLMSKYGLQKRHSIAKKTMVSYTSVILHYVRFCALHGYSTFDVDGLVIIDFYQKYLDPILYAKKGNTITVNSVRNVRTALDFLFKIQSGPRASPNLEMPNLIALQNFIILRRQERASLQTDAYFDKFSRRRATDIPTESEYATLMEACWKNTVNSEEVHRSFNAMFELLLGWSFLFHDDDKRILGPSDFTVMEKNYARHGKMPILVATTWRQKFGSSSGIDTGAARNKNVFKCPFALIGLWFYIQFNTKPLDFSKRSLWYPVKLMYSGNDSKTEMSRTFEGELIPYAYKLIGNSPTSRVRLGRKAGALNADQAGVDPTQIRRQGKWHINDSMQDPYFGDVSLEYCFYDAGFFGNETYYLPRGDFEPPEELKKQIFPWLEVELEKVAERNSYGGIKRTKVHVSGVKTIGESNATAANDDSYIVNESRFIRDKTTPQFLKLLKYLRTTIIQDMVIMNHQTPTMFSDDPLTKHPLYQSYRDSLLAHIASPAVNYSVEKKIADAVPLVAEHLVDLKRSSKYTQVLVNEIHLLRKHVESMDVKLNEFESNTNEIKEMLRQVLNNQMDSSNFHAISIPRSRGTVGIGARSNAAVVNGTRPNAAVVNGTRPNPAVGIAVDPTIVEMSGSIANSGGVAVPAAGSVSGNSLSVGYSTFKMDQNISTVHELYHEWYFGNPSVDFILGIKQYAKAWIKHRSSAEHRYYYRRKAIIGFVDRFAKDWYTWHCNNDASFKSTTPSGKNQIEYEFSKIVEHYKVTNSMSLHQLNNSVEARIRIDKRSKSEKLAQGQVVSDLDDIELLGLFENVMKFSKTRPLN